MSKKALERLHKAKLQISEGTILQVIIPTPFEILQSDETEELRELHRVTKTYWDRYFCALARKAIDAKD